MYETGQVFRWAGGSLLVLAWLNLALRHRAYGRGWLGIIPNSRSPQFVTENREARTLRLSARLFLCGFALALLGEIAKLIAS